MRRALATATRALAACLFVTATAAARPEFDGSIDLDAPTADPALGWPRTVAQDTTWIADWAFDAPNGECDPSGWTTIDHYVRNDGSNDWSVGTDYDGQGFVTSNAAILRRHDPCWVQDGYGNSWDYAVVLRWQSIG